MRHSFRAVSKIKSGKVRQNTPAWFLVCYVDGDYMFRPLCWAIVRSQEVQVRRLHSVQILAIERTATHYQQDLLVVTLCVLMAV